MASSSSSPRTWRYDVFTSFHGPDVRKTFLSHLRKQFNYNGITMFDDEKIERSAVIAPALIQAIKESRISLIVLSRKYASSRWCLDELLEIMKCKEKIGQKVMTVFYGVDPSDVRKQSGEFGNAFNKTCANKTEEHREKWRKALTEVGNIAGEDFENWKNEAKMIEKIASDISVILLDTAPKDFDDMVGLEAHMREMESRLEFDNNDIVKIVAISGPAGIGKTTIARAIKSRHSKNFHHNCFLDLRKLSNCDEYVLREQLLSQVLNLNGIKECHSGLIRERLRDKKVFIILDDVQKINQLDVLADIRCYGPGSRIIVTTEDKGILQQCGINDIYHVDFPTKKDAQAIFCLSAFGKTSPPDAFLYLADVVISICGNLPLGLKVVGSSLRGKSLDDWILELPSLKDSLDKGIESVLELGYKSLKEKEQLIFLCIAVFFNGEDEDYVTSMLDETKLNARCGLGILANRYLIQKVGGRVEMHPLLQVMAMQVISREVFSKRPILVDPHEIGNVLEMETGNGSVVGISFDTTEVKKSIINPKAFKRMFNLLFLKVYNASWSPDFQSPELWSDVLFLDGYFGDKNAFDQENRVGVMRDLTVLKNYNGIDIKKLELQISEDMEFPDRLRLVQWEHYQGKSLPHGFCTENLVKLDLRYSLLEKLWDGTQPLANLKEMYVNCSARLKELPDLSKATNLEILNMFGCSSLVEIPSSVANLRTLKEIKMDYCESLEVIPTLANLTSLEGHININECPKLKIFPDFPTNKTFFYLKNTGVKELPASLRHCSSLKYLHMSGSRNLRTFSTHLPTSLHDLDLSNSGIKSIKSLKCLPNLECLYLSSCKRLVLLPEVPSSLQLLWADNCQALKRGSVPLNTPNADLRFTNCFKLDSETRRAIIQQSYFPNSSRGSNWGILPGSELPEEFVHRTTKNSLTIPPSSFNKVKGCILISPKLLQDIFLLRSGGKFDHLFFDCEINGNFVHRIRIYYKDTIQAEHLFIFGSDFLSFDPSKVSTNIVLKCSVLLDDGVFSEQKKAEYKDYPLDMIEWGIQILTDEKGLSTTWDSGIDNMDTNESGEVSESGEDDEEGSKSECSDVFLKDFPTNKIWLDLNKTGVKDLPASLRHCSCLVALELNGSRNLRTFSTHLPTSIRRLELRNSGIKSITDCIKCLPNLHYLDLSGCKRLVLLPELPSSLHFLKAGNCELLTRVSVPLNTPNANLHFTNCFKLDSQARRAIIQQSYFLVREWARLGMSGWGILPEREVPEDFIHRSTINSLTIPPSAFNRVKGCILISPKLLQDIFRLRRGSVYDSIYFDCKINGNLVRSIEIYYKDTIEAEHLIIFCSDFLSFDPSGVSTNLVLDCRFYLDSDRKERRNYPLDVIEWGIQILMDEKDLSTTWDSGIDNMDTDESGEVSKSGEDDEEGSKSESGEDDEEGSKSESGEASEDELVSLVNRYASFLREPPREMTIKSAARNLKRETKDDVFLQDMAIQETGQCSSLTDESGEISESGEDDEEGSKSECSDVFLKEKWPTLLCFASFSLAMFFAYRYYRRW